MPFLPGDVSNFVYLDVFDDHVLFFRFEPCLRNACKRFVMEHKPADNRPSFFLDDSPNKDINVAFFNIPLLKKYIAIISLYSCFIYFIIYFFIQGCGS